MGMTMAAASTRRRATWEALGTSAVLQVSDPAALAQARAIVERELAAIDRTCSRFRADSDLTRVNEAGGRAVRVDALLVEAVGVALRAAELTDGDVDPTIGAALELAGYDRDWSLLAPADGAADTGHDSAEGVRDAGHDSAEGVRDAGRGSAEGVRDAGHDSAEGVRDAGRGLADGASAPRPLSLPRSRVIHARVRRGWRTVELDRERMTVRVPAPIRLDLGATAKALAADRAARAAAQATGVGVLVSLGGDISTCGESPEGGWLVHVTDDHRSDSSAPGQTITISDGGLATSSTAVRRWSHEGATCHHIIDPDTQRPVTGTWRTASVAAASCVDANIASTAALVRAEEAPAWLKEIGLPARLVDPVGRVRTLGDWPAQPGVVAEATL
jgi:FAD:protein FMN transferase